MKLSQELVEVIRRRIDKSDITMERLKDDVLDHVCCVVESKMKDGKSFEVSLQEAFHEVAPHGLDEIQRKTFYLLQSPRFFLMKGIVYSIGLFSAAALSLGWLFVLLRWPGGPEMLNYGSLVFLMIFVPLLVLSQRKTPLKLRRDKLRQLIGITSSLTVGLSIVFKLFHLQGGELILVAGVLMFTFGFLPFLFFSLYKKAIA
jgi:hypothetical protein